jgi:hypothetical protein
MSLPNYLAQIKSSGIYRFVWDKSEIAGVPAETLRLVVGYSEKGPFNTPVYLQSEAEFKSVFGDISKKLEKRGVFFHRMAMQCLGKGPILALNLKKFANEEVDAVSFNTLDEQIKTIDVPVESIYDTTRFWKLDPEAILSATQNADVTTGHKYISMTSADSKETSCSVFIRGFKPTGYDITVSNWYSSMGEEMPDFFVTEKGDYSSLLVSDFFAEIYVFRGEFTKALCAAEPLSRYFEWDPVNNKAVLKDCIEDAFGNKIDTLSALASDDSSNFVNSYSGCLLPYFKSQVGSYVSLDLLFNADNNRHKMMMNFNSDLLYSGDVKIDQLVTTAWQSNYAFGTLLTPTVQKYDWDAVKEDFVYSNVVSPFEPNFIEYKGTSEHKLDFTALSFEKGDRVIAAIETPTKITVEGDFIKNAIFVENKETFNKLPKTYLKEHHWGDNGLEKSLPWLAVEFAPTKASTLKINVTKPDGTKLPEISYPNVTTDVTLLTLNAAELGTEIVDGTWKVTVNDSTAQFVVAEENAETYENKFWIVSNIASDALEVVSLDGTEAVISAAETVKKCNSSCSITNHNLSPIYFEGYVYEHDKPVEKVVSDEKDENGDPIIKEVPSTRDIAKLDWHNFLLGTLTEYEGIRTALTNRKDIDYRYIVDTFEGLVDTELHKELALIAKEKDNAVAFLNFPSVKAFKSCTYSSFTDDKGKFQVKYIKEGANKQKNPAKLFSLVSELNGASYVSYNTPLIFTDGAVKTAVPSAALVSNNFMEKYTSRQPYYVVAGPTYGRMIWSGMVGPDYNYTRADLDILEPMGVNCMVYVPRLGTYINSNQTAKQNPVTALSKLNIRELVIYLQDQIEALLQDYQWEFNTPYLRDLIKAKADTICERIKNNGGLYQYLNVCDESNNTDDVINNEMFVLSTSIEPGMGCGKMVHELTIYRKGGMQSLIK